MAQGVAKPSSKRSVSPAVWPVGAALLLLAPFLGKPLHMDAPLIVWAAKQIRNDPLNFYGIAVNWFGTLEGLDRILRMPPLFSALVAPLINQEVFLPLVPWVFAALAVGGIGVLGRLWGADPLWTGLAAVATPAFVVCGSLVMPDMALMAFWTWAVVFQVKGHDQPGWWAASAVCATGAVLTKYSGLSVLPLLAFYSVWRTRRMNFGVGVLLIPLGVMAFYQFYTGRLYGEGLFTESARYAMGYAPHTLGWFARKTITTLSFAGGGFAVGLFFMPFLWTRTALVRWAGGAGTVGLAALALGHFESFSLVTPNEIRWSALAHLVVWATGGMQWLALAFLEWRHRRDAASATVFAWLAGTMIFAAYFNWSVTVRSLLPALPAVALLLVWRAQRVGMTPTDRTKAIVPATILAFFAGAADARLAQAARESARQAAELHNAAETLWFEGHWGFQYYLEKGGGRAVDYERLNITPRDLLLIPLNNIRVVFPVRGTVDVVTTLSVPGPWGLTVHHGRQGAGFHSDYWGPLPLAFGFAPPEKTLVLRPRTTLGTVREGGLAPTGRSFGNEPKHSG